MAMHLSAEDVSYETKNVMMKNKDDRSKNYDLSAHNSQARSSNSKHRNGQLQVENVEHGLVVPAVMDKGIGNQTLSKTTHTTPIPTKVTDVSSSQQQASPDSQEHIYSNVCVAYCKPLPVKLDYFESYVKKRKSKMVDFVAEYQVSV